MAHIYLICDVNGTSFNQSLHHTLFFRKKRAGWNESLRLKATLLSSDWGVGRGWELGQVLSLFALHGVLMPRLNDLRPLYAAFLVILAMQSYVLYSRRSTAAAPQTTMEMNVGVPVQPKRFVNLLSEKVDKVLEQSSKNGQLEELRAALAASREQVKVLTEEQHAREEERANLRAGLDAASSALNSADAMREELQARLNESSVELEEAQQRSARLQQELDEATRARGGAKAWHDRAHHGAARSRPDQRTDGAGGVLVATADQAGTPCKQRARRDAARHARTPTHPGAYAGTGIRAANASAEGGDGVEDLGTSIHMPTHTNLCACPYT